MSDQVVHRGNSRSAHTESLGPYQIESLLSEAEEGAATVYRVRLEPHQKTNASYHQIAEEFYYVLSGSATAHLNGVDHPLNPGDFLRLPPGTRHAFTTRDEPLEMLDIHVPGCRPDRDTYFVDMPE